jgi:type II secretory ATPase GspE/PulE/Tfp pilus assembly ATPase PilB-like protein
VANSPYGLFLVVGPTGSGKTTTLYATLMEVDSADRSVVTIEDPVEYLLPGVTQLPVRRKQGLTFASGLRSVLRQDLDVVMEAAQTGHMVLSTLHTSDAVSSVTRLLDLGVEPELLASCLTAVLAQRLVRTICPECREDCVVTAEEQSEFGDELGGVTGLQRGRGCPACMGTGYYGRIGLFEVMAIMHPIRGLIAGGATADAVRDAALEHGMKSLRTDGVQVRTCPPHCLPSTATWSSGFSPVRLVPSPTGRAGTGCCSAWPACCCRLSALS